MLVRDEGFAGFFFAGDFDLRGFLPPEGDFVTDDFVFDGIFERRIEYYPDGLALDESHLYQPFTEAPVSVHMDDHGLLSGLEF